MKKSKYRFGLEYLDRYAAKIFTYKILKDKETGKRYASMRITARKHRDAQQWAYAGKKGEQ
jgi:hypothetical protein